MLIQWIEDLLYTAYQAYVATLGIIIFLVLVEKYTAAAPQQARPKTE